MSQKYIAIIALAFLSFTMVGQKPSGNVPAKPAAVQHHFKDIKTGATMEVVREGGVVKIYILVDDIEQYEQLLIERSDDIQGNFAQCKVVDIQKGKYKNNYVEVVDQYPLPINMPNLYRLKTVNVEGITKMFPPVTVGTQASAKN